MNWYLLKFSDVNNFEDKNRVNHSIKYLSEISNTLKYASQLVYQTGRGARKMVEELANHKVLSSYPDFISPLKKADRLAIDNPKTFASICNDVAYQIDQLVKEFEEERESFAFPSETKGKGIVYE